MLYYDVGTDQRLDRKILKKNIVTKVAIKFLSNNLNIYKSY